MTTFLTGFPGFLGSALVARLVPYVRAHPDAGDGPLT